MFDTMKTDLDTRLNDIAASGHHKVERVLNTQQGAMVRVDGHQPVVNLCANNYLGLATHPDIVTAAKDALDQWGFGMASVRFICGTQSLHKQLEAELAHFLGTEDALLYSSCFDANTGLFETLLDEHDVVISDELNHASIIDGIRLCKARRFRYRNRDMADLEAQLKEASDARHRLIATDGVFSMDGHLAPLPEICELAEKYSALVMVDDSHATGFIGANGRGTHELHDVMNRVDIITGTLGKALGGASGGFVAARAQVVQLLRQRSRPYLFSNSLAPPIAAATLAALALLSRTDEPRQRLEANTLLFRNHMTELGFTIPPGNHPIVPVIIGDAAMATRFSNTLLAKGIYVTSFSHPVVPHGQARLRTQLSAAHSTGDVEHAIEAFANTLRETYH